MIRKMIVQLAGVVVIGVLAVSGCGRSYLAASLRRDFDFSGSYVITAQPVANECSEVRAEQVESRLDAQHRPGEMQLTIVFEGDPYPASLKRDGRFASSKVQRRRGGTTENVTMRGHFGDSTVTASLDVKRDPVRTVLPTSRRQMSPACRYHVNVAGTRVAEPGR
jgi:hypothetical protein